jgi:hypothetical protein
LYRSRLRRREAKPLQPCCADGARCKKRLVAQSFTKTVARAISSDTKEDAAGKQPISPDVYLSKHERVNKEELIAMRAGLDKKPSGVALSFSDYRLVLVSQPHRESAYLMKVAESRDHHVVIFRKRWMQEDFDYPVWV